MALVVHANNKDAVSFKKELFEKIEAQVGQVLNETRIELASSLITENPNGITSSAGGVSTIAAGGEVGKDRLPDTTDIKSSEGGKPPGGTKLAHVETKPGTSLSVDPKLPGQIEVGEEVEKKEPSEKRVESKGKRAMRFAMKKRHDKQRNESVVAQ